jgi:hypothetical protein
MKTIITVLLLALLCNHYSYSQYDVRKVKWGMSRQEVEKIEKNLKKINNKSNSKLCYHATILDYAADLVYSFSKNKLDILTTTFDITKDDGDKMDAYNGIKESLIAKYGEPTRADTFWIDGELRQHLRSMNMGLVYELKSLYTIWENVNNRTNIILALDNNDFKVSIAVEYSSQERQNNIKPDTEGL